MYTAGIQSIEGLSVTGAVMGEEATPVRACSKTVLAVKQSIIQSAPCASKHPRVPAGPWSPPADCSSSVPVQCHYLTPAATQPGYHHTDQELLETLHLLMYLGC